MATTPPSDVQSFPCKRVHRDAVSCERCPQLAAVHCLNCGVDACSPCDSTAHAAPESMKSHVRVPVRDRPAACLCPQRRPATLVCTDDGAMLCVTCAIVGPHAAHTKEEIFGISARKREETRLWIDEAEKQLSSLKLILSTAENQGTTIDEAIAQRKAAIADGVETIVAHVRSWGDSLTRDVEYSKCAAHKATTILRERAQVSLTGLQRAGTAARQAISELGAVDIVRGHTLNAAGAAVAAQVREAHTVETDWSVMVNAFKPEGGACGGAGDGASKSVAGAGACPEKRGAMAMCPLVAGFFQSARDAVAAVLRVDAGPPTYVGAGQSPYPADSAASSPSHTPAPTPAPGGACVPMACGPTAMATASAAASILCPSSAASAAASILCPSSRSPATAAGGAVGGMCPTQQPSSCDRKAKHRLAAQFANVSVNQDDPTARGKALVEEIETGVSNHSAANIAVRTACWRLAEAARSDTVLRRAVLMRGGLSAIFAAMRTFSTAADVQATACLALGTLMSCSTVADVDESPAINAGDALITRQVTNKAMMDDGGVDLIIKALRAHTTNECVQRGACYTLASDSFDASTRASLVAHGGPAVVVAVMNRYADQSAVQYRAIRALVTMTANDRSALLTEDVRAALQAAMQRWPAGPTYPVNPKSPAAGAKTLSPAILAVVGAARGAVWPVPVKPVQLS